MAMFSFLRLGIFSNFTRKTLSNNNAHTLGKFICVPTIRRYTDFPRIGVKLLGEAKYIRKDKIPAGYNLIYRAPMPNYVAIAHHFTTLSALTLGGFALYVIIYGEGELEAPLRLENTLKTDKDDIKYYAIGFILLYLAMRHIVMRYPYRIFRKEKQCIAILEGLLPFVRRKVHFNLGEVTQVEPKGVVPWKDSWYKVNNEKMILLIDYFKTPSELHNMIKPQEF